ncbi:MAG: diguanylate cyclase [Rhodocyclaceae bacterium]|nr:diguanylate cyclase [Rhodocyclaceae bacterium]MBK9310547.1 diguanylate cyclase [Rhodocyclaceae bacterium]MBK9954382.1 diguanylate cyclase [Rhodocyclaceae bacterium]
MTQLGKLHVLLAEDTRSIALPVQAALERAGHRVTHVSSGEEAVAAFERETPDMVLMDIVMPGIGGIEATRRIKVLPADRWVPVMMTTSLDADEDLVAGIEAGADDYLTKPVSPNVLDARMRSMQRIAAIQKSLDSIIDNIIEGIIVIDRAGLVIKFNRAAESMFGYPAREVIGRNVSMLMPPPFRHEHDQYLARYFTTREARIVGKARRVLGQRRNGEVFPMYLGVTEVLTPEGENFIGLVRDLTQEEAMQARIEHLAWHDALTGLVNRASLWQTMEAWLATPAPFALLFLDLDGFKKVNDGHGHGTGDEVLRVAAERLRRALAGTDVVGRFGGDEFVVLLAGIDEERRAFTIANRLVAELSDPVIVDGHEHRIGVSIGIVLRRASDVSAQELVRAADAAMYRAKEGGRNRAVVARPKA